MKKKIIVILTALGLGAAATALYAKSKDIDHFVEEITEELSLNNPQQVAFQEFVQVKQSIRQLRKDHDRKEVKEKFKQLMEKDTITVEEVNGIVGDKMAEKQALKQQAVEKFVNFRNSLTPEQRAEGARILKHMFKKTVFMGRHH